MVQARTPIPPLPPDFLGSLDDWEALHEDWLDEEWESDEPPLESDLHRRQIDLLIRLLEYYWRTRQDFYVSGNTTVFYDPEQRITRNFRGPDFYVVLGAERRNRKSWMVWKERGKYPDVVIEMLSSTTARVDRTTKKDLYQNTWGVTNYFLFDPETLALTGFDLSSGIYQEIAPNAAGHLWSDQLELGLGVCESQLRFFTADGNLVLAPEEAEAAQKEVAEERAAEAEERATQAQEQADEAKERALTAEQQLEQSQAEAERLKAKLRELGVEPD